MDRLDGRGWLELWANSSMCLGSVEVTLTISVTESGWDVHGRLVDDADLDSFAFLRELDEVFRLRFEDDTAFMVTVERADPHGRFTLREVEEPDDDTGRPIR